MTAARDFQRRSETRKSRTNDTDVDIKIDSELSARCRFKHGRLVPSPAVDACIMYRHSTSHHDFINTQSNLC